jgi:hypothetical protein
MTELSPPLRLAAFGAGLAVVLAAAVGVGRLTGDVAQAAPTAAGADSHAAGDSAGAEDSHGGGHDIAAAPAAGQVNGTSLSAGDLRLDAPTTTLPVLKATPFTFRVLDGAEPVRDFEVEQGKQMHLVLVSRDLARHAHVHPELSADGTWTAVLTLSPGSYRAVADFATGGERHSLAVDLAVAGPLTVTPLPPPTTSATVGDVRVELDRGGSTLAFTAYDAAGRAVTPEPYLGARGHLVAFRAGDLAYAHVHPAGEDGARTSYEAELPGPGAYRLFLEIKIAGTVRTVPFTLEVTP